jgi:hypothetical protein
MRPDREVLRAELDEDIDQLRLNHWTIETGWQPKTSQAFVHARLAHLRGLDESMVISSFGADGVPKLERYALACGRSQWIECDEFSFEGFLQEGDSGLMRSTHEVSPAKCFCKKNQLMSAIRAQAFARRVASEAGVEALQRFYRCDDNPRIFHLSSKKDGEPIPGAFVRLPEGWNA